MARKAMRILGKTRTGGLIVDMPIKGLMYANFPRRFRISTRNKR